MENMSHCNATCMTPNDCTKHVHFVLGQQKINKLEKYSESTTFKDVFLHDENVQECRRTTCSS